MSNMPESAPTNRNATEPKYRGFSGAVAYGVFLLVLTVSLGVLAAGAVWKFSGEPTIAIKAFYRLCVLGCAIGVAAGACQWLCAATRRGLWSMRFERGDVGGMIGFFIALLLIGRWEESRRPELLEAPLVESSTQSETGDTGSRQKPSGINASGVEETDQTLPGPIAGEWLDWLQLFGWLIVGMLGPAPYVLIPITVAATIIGGQLDVSVRRLLGLGKS